MSDYQNCRATIVEWTAFNGTPEKATEVSDILHKSDPNPEIRLLGKYVLDLKLKDKEYKGYLKKVYEARVTVQNMKCEPI